MSWEEVRDRETARLRQSGWALSAPLQDLLAREGLSQPADVVTSVCDRGRWNRVGQLVGSLQEHFGSCRFAEEVDYGLLAVPVPERIDTRGCLPSTVRQGHHEGLGEDLLAPGLGPGTDLAGEALDLYALPG